MAPFAADLLADADEALRAKLEEQHEAWLKATGGHPWDPPDWAGGDDCPAPFAPAKWDETRRALLRAELDAYYARLYGLTRDELRYILDPKDVYGPDFPGETFRVLKEKEERAFGEYRTRRLVLEAWDRLEKELGPVVVRNYREEMNGGQEDRSPTGMLRDQETGVRGQRVVEVGPKYQATVQSVAPARPQFGAIPAPAPAVKPAPAAEPETDTGQRDLFGEPVAPASQPAKAKPAPPKPEPAAQPALIFAPPQGAYTERLSRVMALRAKGTPEAISEVVAALGDEDERIRWLAGSVLQSIGGETVIATLRAFIGQAETEVAREEAEKLLGKLTERA